MNKNFWLFTVVCALFVSSFFEWSASFTNLSIPRVVPRNTSYGTKT